MAKTKPLKKLLAPRKSKAGRSHGKITVRHRGGGHKRRYRLVDFQRLAMLEIPAKVESLEYDPNRSCLIAKILYVNGKRSYILAPDKIKVGDKVVTAESAPIKLGNRMRLENIPTGTSVYNIETIPERGGKLARSAGNYAQLTAKEKKHAQLIMPSKEIRLVLTRCFASIGQLSNSQANTKKLRKAGQKRWRGIRPTVRGSAMNPVDHPHGGGEGRSPIGLKHPKTPWGKPAMGKKTRRKKYSDRLIVKRRAKRRR
jgi:large subunit ribosomal protein L2